jgi:Undecaprenyl-phosphate galactose phosphotransferase WbaP
MTSLLETTPEIVLVLKKNQTIRSSVWLRHSRLWMTAALILADLASLLIANGLAIVIRTSLLGGNLRLLFLRFLPLILVFLVIYALRGLYPGIGVSPVNELRRLSLATGMVYLILAAYTFVTRVPPEYSRMVFAIGLLLTLFLVPLSRSMIRTFFGSRLGIWGEPIAVVGQNGFAREIYHHLNSNPLVGLKPVAIFSDEKIQANEENISILPVSSIPAVCGKFGIRTAIITTNESNAQGVLQFDAYHDLFERVIFVNGRTEPQMLWVSYKDLGGILGMEIRHDLLNNWTQIQKWIIDIFAAVVGLIILIPLFIVISILIKLDSPGPVFYRHPRVGKEGKTFLIYKFRTMVSNAEEVLDDYLQKNPELKREWEYYQKLREDPRVSRIGRFLRRFSIDELPQLWNIIKGEMSLVGPRPFIADQLELYGEKYPHYIRVRPGITGMWQVSGRNEASFVERAVWDEYYVLNWSIWLDIYILARTFWVVVKRHGAF